MLLRNEGSEEQRRLLLRLVTTALLLYALGHYTAARIRLTETETLTAMLEAERAALAAEHAALLEEENGRGSVEALEARARRELGLVRPGELVFYFEDAETD